METQKTNIGVTYGLISGLVSVVFSVILYLGGVQWFVHPVAYLGYVLPIVVAVLAGLRKRKMDGGFIDFAGGLKVAFTTFVIGTFISILFTYVLFNYIDVPFREALAQETAEKARQMMQKFGLGEADIEKATEQMMDSNSFSLSKQLLGGAFSCILWFMISVIIAAIIKKKRPEFTPPVQ